MTSILSLFVPLHDITSNKGNTIYTGCYIIYNVMILIENVVKLFGILIGIIY